MTIETKFGIGQFVYLNTDEEQKKRLITGIAIYEKGTEYNLASNGSHNWHYELEMTTDKDECLLLGLEKKEK